MLKALTIALLALLVLTVSMILSTTEEGDFLEILFETTSAFGTVGLHGLNARSDGVREGFDQHYDVCRTIGAFDACLCTGAKRVKNYIVIRKAK